MSKGRRPKRDAISRELRERVLKRDSYACRYCYSTKGPFHMDHVYPFSKGGQTSFENLVTACKTCNIRKHNKVGVWPRPLKFVRRHYPAIRMRVLPKATVPDKTAWVLEFPPLPKPIPVTPAYKTRAFWDWYCGVAIKSFSWMGLSTLLALIPYGLENVEPNRLIMILFMWAIPFVQVTVMCAVDFWEWLVWLKSEVISMLFVIAKKEITQ